MEGLLEAEAAGQRLEFLFFWGHTPPAGGRIGPHVLSQWFEHPFAVEDVTYRSAEHYMMASKARLFGDEERLALILDAASPGAAKAYGGAVRGFDESTWHEHRLDIVVRGSEAKFVSDDELRSYLVGTGERVLVEASPRDRIWGIGMSGNDPAAEHPSRWKGLNLLGFALMEARARLAS
jgi:ribA/ribD-fused uncharacterized protein